MRWHVKSRKSSSDERCVIKTPITTRTVTAKIGTEAYRINSPPRPNMRRSESRRRPIAHLIDSLMLFVHPSGSPSKSRLGSAFHSRAGNTGSKNATDASLRNELTDESSPGSRLQSIDILGVSSWFSWRWIARAFFGTSGWDRFFGD